MSFDHYTYRVTWSHEDGEHVGLCVFPPSSGWQKRQKLRLRARVKLLQVSLPILKQTANLFLSHWRKSTIAVSFVCVSRPNCTASLL